LKEHAHQTAQSRSQESPEQAVNRLQCENSTETNRKTYPIK
jgi:hypothetical protein